MPPSYSARAEGSQLRGAGRSRSVTGRDAAMEGAAAVNAGRAGT